MNRLSSQLNQRKPLLTSEQWARLISDLVEELRRALADLTTLSALMVEEANRPGAVPDDRLAQSLNHRTRELQVLIEDASQFVRLTQGQVSYEVHTIPVDDLVGRLEIALRPTAWAREILIGTKTGKGLPEIMHTDVDILLRTITHLVDSVACFSDREVSVWIGASGGRLLIRVKSDRGSEGLERMEALLRPVSGAASYRPRKSGARALALLLSRELARSLGGDLAFIQGSPAAYELGIPLAA
ncbi:MAG: hypothetical protein MPN21_23435 [Thermoanaerobaculia bacterium]|nr:hypothetical protein [Thermoanaerobaculia bacterium]